MPRRGVHFEVIGLSNLTRSLELLSAHVVAQVADAVDDTAHAIQYRARVNVPRDKGDLERAIQLGGKGLRRTVGLDDAVVSGRGGDRTHQNPWIYGLFVEFGLRVKQYPKQAFMGPAADAEVPLHQARIERALDRAASS